MTVNNNVASSNEITFGLGTNLVPWCSNKYNKKEIGKDDPAVFCLIDHIKNMLLWKGKISSDDDFKKYFEKAVIEFKRADDGQVTHFSVKIDYWNEGSNRKIMDNVPQLVIDESSFNQFNVGLTEDQKKLNENLKYHIASLSEKISSKIDPDALKKKKIEQNKEKKVKRKEATPPTSPIVKLKLHSKEILNNNSYGFRGDDEAYKISEDGSVNLFNRNTKEQIKQVSSPTHPLPLSEKAKREIPREMLMALKDVKDIDTRRRNGRRDLNVRTDSPTGSPNFSGSHTPKFSGKNSRDTTLGSTPEGTPDHSPTISRKEDTSRGDTPSRSLNQSLDTLPNLEEIVNQPVVPGSEEGPINYLSSSGSATDISSGSSNDTTPGNSSPINANSSPKVNLNSFTRNRDPRSVKFLKKTKIKISSAELNAAPKILESPETKKSLKASSELTDSPVESEKMPKDVSPDINNPSSEFETVDI